MAAPMMHQLPLNMAHSRFQGAGLDSGSQRTTDPIVTGSSVLAISFNGGVMTMTDTLASYGRLARFKDVQRVTKVNDCAVMAASGEYSDYQYLCNILDAKVVEDIVQEDGSQLTPNEIFSWVSRIMYHRRSNFNPLYNGVVIAGFRDGKSLIGVADHQGTFYTGDFVATGMGAHMALPLLRNSWRPDMSQAEARELLEDCMRVLFYRDCRALNRYHLSTVTADGVTISEPFKLSTQWSFKRFVNPGEPARDKPVQKVVDVQGQPLDQDEMKDQE